MEVEKSGMFIEQIKSKPTQWSFLLQFSSCSSVSVDNNTKKQRRGKQQRRSRSTHHVSDI